ncbi:phage shock protein G [Vibrio sp. 10N.286.49.C2]|uniref:envelope stress response protein PspG n=1 Tax=unclassified Vibrio TaxID=2614977 RepID=UPI000C81FB9C|nr:MULTISPECIES: envelope stress response protein PspG [unclassified Vibrio]PMH40224.1 phage shock protein G [Vibrio sp. 10N.286.49.C2]PMH46323.1 phage shock protein G [Vibrio sp. 10N.286.49.B1]PMH82033.1 phage shock protein G [Vibrio sp. 10N.286.48.B7]
MFELIFIMVFIGVLVMTGVTFVTVSLAIVASFTVLFMLGMVGVLFQLLPWIVAFVIALWVYNRFIARSS